MGTHIQWTDETWNPVTGCTKVSAGCEHCYIERTPPFRMQHRKFDKPGVGGTTGVTMHPERLDQPLHWRKPRRVFVNSLSDLFHAEVPDEFIARVFAIMAVSYWHTFQLLTKRHPRMRSLLGSDRFAELFDREFCALPDWVSRHPDLDFAPPRHNWHLGSGPLSNVWLGVSVEDQQGADIRIPALLDTPAAVRFLSCEPLLGPVRFSEPWLGRWASMAEPVEKRVGIDWVIVGGESGPGSRAMHPDWARSLRDQCVAAGVPFLFKQWGNWAPVSWADSRLADTVLDYSGQVSEVMQAHATTRGVVMRNVGKHKAGRELDSRTWDEYPTAPVTAAVRGGS